MTDIGHEMAAHLEMTALGVALAVSGLQEKGLSRADAAREYARLRRRRFGTKDDGLARRAWMAGIWGRGKSRITKSMNGGAK